MKVANLFLIVVLTVFLSACAGKKPKMGGGGGGGGGPKGGGPPKACNKNPGQPGNPGDPAAGIIDDGEDDAPGLKERIENELAERNNGFDDTIELIDETGLNPGTGGNEEAPFLTGDGTETHNDGDRTDPALFEGPADPNNPDEVFDPSVRFTDEQLTQRDPFQLPNNPTH